MPNVEIYFDSELTADDVLAFGFENVAIATGATWRRDGVARFHQHPIEIDGAMPVFTPDDLMAGTLPEGRVVLFDDDHFYMGGVLAELLVGEGRAVSLVTPASEVSQWTHNTLEQEFIQGKLIDLGVDIHVTRAVSAIAGDHVTLQCIYSGRESRLDADGVVLVTARTGNDGIWTQMRSRESDWADAGINSVRLIGDAEAPAPIAWATYAGRRFGGGTGCAGGRSGRAAVPARARGACGSVGNTRLSWCDCFISG